MARDIKSSHNLGTRKPQKVKKPKVVRKPRRK